MFLVTLTGTGFGVSQNSSTVSFEGSEANINTWDNKEIKARVPFVY